MLRAESRLLPVYEPSEEGWQGLEAHFAAVNDALEAAGLEVFAAPEPVCDEESAGRVATLFAGQPVDLLHALVITWSFDHYTVAILQRSGAPLVIRALPGIRSGSMVGSQQLGSLLTDLEVEHRLVYGPLDDSKPIRETTIFARACALRNRLKGARFALLGRRTPGMTPIAVDELELLRLFGVRAVPLGMDEFNELVEKVDPAEARTAWKQVAAGAAVVSADPEQGVASLRHYLAARRLVVDLGLAGITFGSYPACQGTACLPIALLNDKGIATGCEGDLNSTLLMWLLGQLSDQPVHFGEMLEIDEVENTLVSSHCGAASLSLAGEDGYVLCPVRLAQRGVCVRFSARPGPVTFANLVGRRGSYRLCAFEGEAAPVGMVFAGNPLKFRLNTPFRQIWSAVAEYGFGHHWMSAYAHVTPELVEFCRLVGMRGVFPDQGQVVNP
jgi:L-fucose isomerase-like protein